MDDNSSDANDGYGVWKVVALTAHSAQEMEDALNQQEQGFKETVYSLVQVVPDGSGAYFALWSGWHDDSDSAPSPELAN